jgi:UDP-GlcNAc3NAcA epimerase
MCESIDRAPASYAVVLIIWFAFMKILTVVGARPQFIKAAVFSKAIREAGHEEIMVHTGQHYDGAMSAVFFDELGIPEPFRNLGVGSGSHGYQTGAMLSGLEAVMLVETPAWVITFGDTNSTLAGALAAAKLRIRTAHVEAGLRSFNRSMPEEINRVIVDHVSDLLFCPSETALRNLASEGLSRGGHIVGDVMAEAHAHARSVAQSRATIVAREGLQGESYYLATLHRAENTDNRERLEQILRAFSAIPGVVVLPLHPRTERRIGEFGLESYLQSRNLRVLEPVGYLDMVALECSASAILTDSGGVQKEAYWAGVPCITLRDETEWVETMANNWNVLAGASTERILNAVDSASVMKDRPPLFGEGNVGQKCLALMESHSK